MSYLLTLLLSLLGLNSSTAAAKTVDDHTLIAQQNASESANRAAPGSDLQIKQDDFSAFFHS